MGETGSSPDARKSRKRKAPITDIVQNRISKQARLKNTESLLSTANSLPVAEFTSKYMPISHEIHAKDGESYAWTIRTSSGLTDPEFEACFNLIEETSGEDYRNAKQGWNPKQKREEMREADMRYLLLRRTGQHQRAANDDNTTEKRVDEDQILAFISFMLTPEDALPVAYIYEIHLISELRGKGIGKALMSMVEEVGKKVDVEMVMLTVFTANIHAETFYQRLGYSVDASSPRERRLRGGKIRRPEYLIMSRQLRRRK